MNKAIRDKIYQESVASSKLKLYAKDEKLSWEKSREIDKEQDYHWNKMQFFKKFLSAKEKNESNIEVEKCDQ